jgi:hypothetical protein
MNPKVFCRLWAHKRTRRTMLVLCGLILLFAVADGTERALRGTSDFTGFRRIIQVSLVRNEDQYKAIPKIRAYPPFFAIFWAPFGLFPWGLVPQSEHPSLGLPVWQELQLALSAFVLIAAMGALTLWVVWWIVKACRATGGADGVGLSAGLVALIWTLAGQMMFGPVVQCETDMLVVAMVSGGMLLLLARGRPWAGGALLGVAAALKLTPGLFAVYLLCRRQWHALGAMALSGLVCTALLPALVWGPGGAVERDRSWVSAVLLPCLRQGPEAFISHAYDNDNQSVKGAVVRFLTNDNRNEHLKKRDDVHVAELSMGAARATATAVKAVLFLGLLVAWLLPERRVRDDLEPLLFALVPIGMLLLSDLSIEGHFAVVVVPIGVLTCFAFRHSEEPLGRTVFVAVLVGAGLLNLRVRFFEDYSVQVAALLFLYGFTIWLALRTHGHNEARGSPKPSVLHRP